MREILQISRSRLRTKGERRMAEKKELTCICCPMGCALTATLEEGKVTEVTGNTCPRGDAYARKELTAPTRIVTSIVRLEGGELPVVPVKTAQDIPKEKIWKCMKEIKKAVLKAPVRIGDVAVADAAGSGVDVIVTKNVDAI